METKSAKCDTDKNENEKEEEEEEGEAGTNERTAGHTSNGKDGVCKTKRIIWFISTLCILR